MAITRYVLQVLTLLWVNGKGGVLNVMLQNILLIFAVIICDGKYALYLLSKPLSWYSGELRCKLAHSIVSHCVTDSEGVLM